MTFPTLKSPLKFYAVVPTADWVERMVKAGADTVQLRCKTLHGDELKREIARCVAACQGSRTQLFINDHWRKAIEAGAYGVHLGQEDMDTADLAAIAAAGLRLGLSTHSVAELDRALSVAIGGIDLNNARAVLATGVSSLAVVRAVTEAENPEAVVKAFQALWNE